jgi:hypothetical protein
LCLLTFAVECPGTGWNGSKVVAALPPGTPPKRVLRRWSPQRTRLIRAHLPASEFFSMLAEILFGSPRKLPGSRRTPKNSRRIIQDRRSDPDMVLRIEG